MPDLHGAARRAFLSYRTEDTLAVADRLAVELQRVLEIEVFLDHRSLDGGDVWPDRLLEEVERSDVVLVLIGSRWLTLQTSDGIRRLDDPDDWVRKEIERALATARTIIPILVDGALPIEKRALRTVPTIEAFAAFEVDTQRECRRQLSDETVKELRTEIVSLIDEEWERILRASYLDTLRYVENYPQYKHREVDEEFTRWTREPKPSVQGGKLFSILDALLAEAQATLALGDNPQDA